MIKIKVFGKLIEVFKTAEYIITTEVETVSELRKDLEIHFPELKRLNYLVAVDQEIIREQEFLLKDKTEVALLPPYSGG